MWQPYSATADAAGAATITVRPRDARGWSVSQVSIEMLRGSAAAVSGTAVCWLRRNGAPIAPMVAQGDAAGEAPAVDLQAADVLTIEWTSCTPGNVCNATVAYTALGA